MFERLTWTEVNLKEYGYNLRQIKKLIGRKVKLMAVVKANAYGHGITAMGKASEKSGAEYLGVVCLQEGRMLREAGVKIPILILNYIDPEGVKKALDLDLTVNVMDSEVLETLDNYARKKGRRARIHVKIDSGMHRAGVMPDVAVSFIRSIEGYKNIKLEGIFTHFATSDEKNLDFTREQLKRFNIVLKSLKSPSDLIIHTANSGAVMRLPESYFQMVRPGICIYGIAPSRDFKMPFEPHPIMELKTKLIQLRKIGKGETVGYGRTWKAKEETLVGLLPVGYGDGYRRGPVNAGYVLIRGRKVPILGRISMDQTSIDLSRIRNIHLGEEVTLISNKVGGGLSAEELSLRLGTIPHEVFTALSGRVSRIYIQ